MVNAKKDKGLHTLSENRHLPKSYLESLAAATPTTPVDTDLGSGRTFRMICSLIGHMMAGETVILFSTNVRHDFYEVCKVLQICNLSYDDFIVHQPASIVEYRHTKGRIMVVAVGNRLDKFNGLRPSIFAIDHRVEESSSPYEVNTINDEMWARRHRRVTCK